MEIWIQLEGHDVEVEGLYVPAEPETGLGEYFEILRVLYHGVDISDFIHDLSEVEEKAINRLKGGGFYE